MKVKAEETTGFKPIELTITLETPEEAGAIFAVFNYTKIVGVLEECGIDHEKIRRAIDGQFTRKINYNDALRKLQQVFDGD